MVFRHSGLLGTVIDIRLTAGRLAEEIDRLVVAEIERLERVFSAFDPASEFSRWRSGDSATASATFAELMDLALGWQRRSQGGFNPMSGALTARWKQAEAEDCLPTEQQMIEIADRIRAPRFEMVDGRPIAIADCSTMNLHAIAKGYIVDRSIDRASERLADRPGSWISVNAGGDLAHRGDGSVRVGIENPHRPYDNEPPLVTVELANAAIATSGSARRGFRVQGKWYGHVFDPRSGWPVESIASISVIGPDAATADVVATAAGVLPTEQALAFVEGIDETEAMIVGNDRERSATSGWPVRPA